MSIPLVMTTTPSQPQTERWDHGEIWHGLTHLQIELGDFHWYGQGGLVHQVYPLERMAQYAAPFLTSDNGATGLSGILHPLWANHNGTGIEVLDHDHLIVGFNAPQDGTPPEHSFATAGIPHRDRPPLASDVTGNGRLIIESANGEPFRVRFYTKSHIREVIETFWNTLQITDPPPNIYFEKVMWTTWAHFKNDISHDKILDYANNIQAYGFPSHHFGIDAKWQDEFGSTTFDPEKFPDPKATVQALHDLGLDTTLWCIPFFNENSEHFKPATDQDRVVKNTDGTPFIQTWWEGQAALLNVLDADALAWHMNNLKILADQVGIDGFKFDAGEGMFFDLPDTNIGQTGNRPTTHYIQNITFPWSDVRTAWRNQSESMLFRQWDKSTTWGHDNGLASCISQAITLNLLGYPYHLPDMIGGNQYGDETPTEELLIRWTQAVSAMPIIQFSIPPWQFGDACAKLCARYAKLHQDLAPYHINNAKQGVPLIRPLWWLAPRDEDALTIADSYLVGDDLLVAPVVTEGAQSRDVYLPQGTWRSYWDDQELYTGGQWIRDYPAPLETLPLFVHIK